MNFLQLEVFRETICTGSIKRVAEQMNLSERGIVDVITDLERDIGLSLFTQNDKGLEPTSEAHRFYKTVENKFLTIDRLRNLSSKAAASKI